MKKGPALPAFFLLHPPGEGARRAYEGAHFRMARMRGNDWLLPSSVAARHLLPEGEGQPTPPSPACGCPRTAVDQLVVRVDAGLVRLLVEHQLDGVVGAGDVVLLQVQHLL